ncbi:SurE domain-containing protein [Mycena indigotica]|uniref:SurE domain-containing protein n=1 Tax=Mycena indigotica TaxID=2126181 RepID=A0A8H6SG45_9AGAR|nr:SurE domain-containing protein [Mycena indigotica]KAF7297220.1 SurE domain-containing protein [Mycena indigotica]
MRTCAREERIKASTTCKFQTMARLFHTVLLAALIGAAAAEAGQKLVLTNDDGWAAAFVRAHESALNAAGYDVVLSCPAVDKSGTGSSTATPTVLTNPCEFNTCPVGSPPEGFNASNPRQNYVNAFPVDSARFGIQTLAPKFFNGSAPDLVVAGPNVGSNAGSTVLISGTVGAATEAVLEGFPAIAFSGGSGSQVSYTTLESDPTSTTSRAALLYADLSIPLVNQLLSTPKPFLPGGILLNVNFPSLTSNCTAASAFKYVLARINPASSGTPPDVSTCGTTRLPTENSIISRSTECLVSVSVMQASNKGDATAGNQTFVLEKLSPILSCSS